MPNPPPQDSKTSEEGFGPEVGITLDSWQDTHLALRNGHITWRDRGTNVVASVHNIEFFLTPLALPTRKAAHYYATVKSADLPGEYRVRDLDVELLRTEGTYLVLNLAAVRQSSSIVSNRDGSPKGRRSSTERIRPVTAAPSIRPPLVEDIAPVPSLIPAPKPPESAPLEQFIRSELEDALRSGGRD